MSSPLSQPALLIELLDSLLNVSSVQTDLWNFIALLVWQKRLFRTWVWLLTGKLQKISFLFKGSVHKTTYFPHFSNKDTAWGERDRYMLIFWFSFWLPCCSAVETAGVSVTNCSKRQCRYFNTRLIVARIYIQKISSYLKSITNKCP